MSAVRLGPVMKLIDAPRASARASPRARPRGRGPACGQRLDEHVAIEDRHVAGRQQRRRARAAGAGDHDERAGLGDREIHAGHAEVGRRGDRPQALRARSPVTSPAGIGVDLEARAPPAAAARSRPSASRMPGHHAAASRARPRSRAMTSGTSRDAATRWNTPPTRSNSRAKRSRVSGHRSDSSRRRTLEPLARPGRARRRSRPGRAPASGPSRRGSAPGTRRAWSSPASRSSSAQRSWKVRAATGGRSRVRVHSPKNSGRRADGGRRARTAAGAAAPSGARQPVERRPAQQPAEGAEDHALGPRRDAPLVHLACAARPACAGCRSAPGRRPRTRRRATRRGRDPSPTPCPFEHRGQEDADRARDTCSRRRGRRSAGRPGQTLRQAPQRRQESASRSVPGDLVDAPVVEQDQVELLGPLQLARRAAGRAPATCRRTASGRWRSWPGWPGTPRGRSWTGTTFSTPITATCTRGSEVTMRPLPSLVTSTTVPVSATAKLAPVIPMSASRNFSRSSAARDRA